jgi:hypothetical protein
MSTAVLIGYYPATPPLLTAFGLIYEGRYWSAKTDDISLHPSFLMEPCVQVYDPKKNTWKPIADLSAKRWKCGLVTLGGYLYAVGGMDSPRAGFWGAPLNTGLLLHYMCICR